LIARAFIGQCFRHSFLWQKYLKEVVVNRREFVINASSAAALLSAFPASLSAVERSHEPGRLERRSLGKTGKKLSILGFGGIVVMNATPEEASRRVAEAIDAGINYFDVAPSYGNAEERLGPRVKAVSGGSTCLLPACAVPWD
jgi:Aldo/keto reductase family